jgi:MFS family permease
MILSSSTALLVMAYPPRQRGQVLGINVACVYSGLSLGPFLGGVLTQTTGWRSIFWVITGLSLIAVILTLFLVRNEWATARGEKFDLTGSIVYGIGLIALIWGLSQLPNLTGFISIIAGISTLAGFIVRELNISSPVLNINLFIKNRVFGLSNLAALINYASTFAVTFLLSLYLQYIKAMTPANAGMVILLMPVLQAIFSPFTGRFSDIIEPRILASSGMALTLIGLLMLVFLDSDTSTVYLIISLAILGVGFALFSSPNTNAVMSSIGKESLAIASATLATMRLIGQMFSMGIAMLVLATIMGNLQILPEFYPQFQLSVRYSFVIFTLLCFGGIFASMARGKVH